MVEMCTTCGLPQELCVCEDVEEEQSTVSIRVEERSHGKQVTIVEDIPPEVDTDSLSTTLKKQLACGGTTREEEIELQGYHREKTKEILNEEGLEVK